MLDEIVKRGGEGLMLHRADSMYHIGRNDDLLKLKTWQDAEVTVIEILPGRAKFSCIVGCVTAKRQKWSYFLHRHRFQSQRAAKSYATCFCH